MRVGGCRAEPGAGRIVSPGFVSIPDGAVRGYVTHNNRPAPRALVVLVRPNGTVWDEAAGAYVMPWEVGTNLPDRIYNWMNSPDFGFTSSNRPIHITLNVDGRVLSEVVAAEMARAY